MGSLGGGGGPLSSRYYWGHLGPGFHVYFSSRQPVIYFENTFLSDKQYLSTIPDLNLYSLQPILKTYLNIRNCRVIDPNYLT